MVTNSYWPSSQSWHRYWPSGVIALIAVIQLFFSFAVLGLHGSIVGIGLVFSCVTSISWYVMGFVCWAFFLACWISIFCVTCCNRSSVGCATYVMIKNILALVFSAVLIDFDRRFINGQLLDYTFVAIGGCTSLYNTDTNFGNILLSLAKAQLAASVIILVSSLVFIAIYIYVYIRAVNDDRGGNNENFPSSGQRPTYAMPQPNWSFKVPPPTEYQEEATHLERSIVHTVDGLQTVVCQRCGTTIDIPERF